VSRQRLVLVLAGAFFAAALALVLAVTLGGSDGPAPGSPDAVTDNFAAAVRSADVTTAAQLSCRPARARVARAVRAVGSDVTSAGRRGSAHVQGAVALDQLQLGLSGGKTVAATVAMSQVAGKWCVAAFAAALPTR
jgi:hypothetical protein